MQILKWQVPMGAPDGFELMLPLHSKVVLFGPDGNDILSMWTEHPDTAAPLEVRKFCLVGTGWDGWERAYPAGVMHIQSACIGAFVWHLYAVDGRGNR